MNCGRTMSSSSRSKRVLLVCDFDHTIVDSNTDTWIFKLLPGGRVPDDITKRYKKHRSWRKYITDVLNHMHSQGVKPQQLVDCIREMCFAPGMKEMLQYQSRRADDVDCIILSDSNTVFIDSLLEGEDLRGAVGHVITNPSHFDEEGCLKVRHYHSHDCRSCPENLCKRKVLREYLREQERGGVSYRCVCYVGDGSNDFCPSLTLHEQDFVFPRIGYSLLDKIKNHKKSGNNFSAKISPWNSGTEIIQTLDMILE